MVGKSGTGITVDFISNVSNKNKYKHDYVSCDLLSTKMNYDCVIDGVKLKFISFLVNDYAQIWRNKPMLLNIVETLKKRTNAESIDSLLS